MADYEAVIGLEVHAQLLTESKLFCACSTRFGEEPNENVCPVCSGMPGVLPVLNRKAVEYAARMALAVNCEVNGKSVFARKNYFYPDLPKGYQISQYEDPLAEHGWVEIEAGGEKKKIGITRIHMEDDAGKNIHSPVENVSFVDLNRSGVPLIEIVSEPDIRSPEQAVAYLKTLHRILLYLGICDGNMEEGSFRCDANVSIRPRGTEPFGTRTELKNMNSFKYVQAALEYEIERQEDLLADGEAVVQETRLFDTSRGVTLSMRGKEEAHDYRYFPDPDLIPAVIDRKWLDKIRQALPELPVERRRRLQGEYGIPSYDAEVLTADKAVADYFEAAVKSGANAKTVSNFVMSELMREMRQTGAGVAEAKFTPAMMAELAGLVDDEVISLKIARQIFSDVFAGGLSPKAYVEEKGLVQISDSGALETAVDEVLAENPDEVEAFRGGKKKLMGFFVGQVMKKTRGQANPKLVNELLGKKLS
jgi:aspartyl-tRNA(Asn)/glutamyl-tRNA(Gln) amidotransferase subunit B